MYSIESDDGHSTVPKTKSTCAYVRLPFLPQCVSTVGYLFPADFSQVAERTVDWTATLLPISSSQINLVSSRIRGHLLERTAHMHPTVLRSEFCTPLLDWKVNERAITPLYHSWRTNLDWLAKCRTLTQFSNYINSPTWSGRVTMRINNRYGRLEKDILEQPCLRVD